MDSHPPTYTSATTTLLHDPLPLLAPYLPRPALLAATLVSRAWNKTFARQLWGDPAAAFSPHLTDRDEEDTPGFDHRAFAACLSRARLSTRRLVHTLDLSPPSPSLHPHPRRRTSSVVNARTAGSAPLPDRDLYATTSASARPTWLRDMTQRLPALRSLRLTAAEDVGHEVLVAFSTPGPGPNALAGLKVLDVADMPHATATGLLALLQKCEGLVYLDVSRTLAARDTAVLAQLGRLRCLRVLVARGLGRLGPERAGALVRGMGRRVRWVDLRGTVLGGEGVRALGRECVGVAWGAAEGEEVEPPAYGDVCAREGAGEERAENFAGDVRRGLERVGGGRLSVEDEVEGGLTHLMVDGAGMSMRELGALVGRVGLVYLDVDSGVGEAAETVRVGARTVLRQLRVPYTVFFALFGHGLDGSDSPTQSELTMPSSDLLRSLRTNLPALRTLTLTHVPASTHAPSATSKSLAPASLEAQDPAALIISLVRALAILRQTAQAQAKARAQAAQAASPAPVDASADVDADAAPLYTPTPTLATSPSTELPPTPTPKTHSHPSTTLTARTARALHPLTTLVLEISPGTFTFPFPSPHDPNTHSNANTHPNAHARRLTSTALPTRGWNHPSRTKSVTGDADSEALWVGAEGGGDFSFFDEGDGDGDGREVEGVLGREVEVVDIVARVAAFRREARGRWREGEVGVVEGYWDGEVRVVRNY